MLSAFPPPSLHLPLSQERYLNSCHVANYILTGPQPNHFPTESSSYHHPSDHSHVQLLFSFCWTHQLHYTFLDLRGRHSGCRGKVSFWLTCHSSPLGSPNITARGNCSLPYSQPHWDRSSNCTDFRTPAMWMTLRHTCLLSQMILQSLTISQTVSWASLHACRIIVSNLKLVKPSSCFSWLTNPFITRLFKVLESQLMINCLFLIIYPQNPGHAALPHSTPKKISLFLTQHAIQLMVQKSRLFSYLVPQWWNNLTSSVR